MEEGIPLIERHLLAMGMETKAYKFDGAGDYVKKWDLAECREREFCWYHVQLPKGNQSQLFKYLIDVFAPLLKPRDILSLIKSGRFCGHVDDAVIFRVTSADPASTSFTFKFAVRVTGNSVISVSQDRVPSFKSPLRGNSILEPPNGQQQGESSGFVIDEHTLESFMSVRHSQEADYSVPKSVSNLVIHIIEICVAQHEDDVDKLQTDLNALEHINAGDSGRKQLLQGRSCAELLTKSQRISLVIAQWEQVLPQFKGKCSCKQLLVDADVCKLEEFSGRLRKLKENVEIIFKQVKTIQTDLQGWQSNQINRKLYYISLVTTFFLPLSLVTGVFGMNVGGIPWTSQKGHPEKEGFRNVMLLCAILVIAMLCLLWFFESSFWSMPWMWLEDSSRVEQLLNWRPFLRRPMGETVPADTGLTSAFLDSTRSS
ncbi:hypothetical protein Droror1_Dr00001235 [Drosera rotundifolia]